MKKLSQGAKANVDGKELENEVEKFLNDRGISSVYYRDWENDNYTISLNTSGILLKNVPYPNVYGGNGRGEFVLSVDGRSDVRIECRLQNVSGSVDEKFPYLFETACAFEERVVILVVEGNGFKKGAVAWLKNKCASIMYKKIYVLNFEEFKDWALSYLPNNTREMGASN
jgi:hypothetical protein